MLYINELLRQKPLLRWVDSFIPEMYECFSLKDLVENKKELKPTRKILPLGIFFYNKACVFISTSVIYNSIDEKLGELTDLTGGIEILLGKSLEDKKSVLSNGMRLYSPFLIYQPKKEKIELADYKENGPEQPGRNDIKEPSIISAPAFAIN